MANSALALGHESLRLRSRRVRSDRSHRLSVRFTLAAIVAATATGFVGSSFRAHSVPTSDLQQLEEQSYLAAPGELQGYLDATVLSVEKALGLSDVHDPPGSGTGD
jgi:hypothetical protein